MAYFKALIKKRKSQDAVSIKDKITYPVAVSHSRPLPPIPCHTRTPSDASIASIVPATLAFPKPPNRSPIYTATPFDHRTRETGDGDRQRVSDDSKARSPRGSGESRRSGRGHARTRDSKERQNAQIPSPPRVREPAEKRSKSPRVSVAPMLPVLNIGDMIYDDSMTSSAASTAILTPPPSGQVYSLDSPATSSPLRPKLHSRHTNPIVIIHPDTSLDSTVELSFSPEASPVKISKAQTAKVLDSGSVKNVQDTPSDKPVARVSEASAMVARDFASSPCAEHPRVPSLVQAHGSAHDSTFSSDSEYSVNTSVVAPRPSRPGDASSCWSVTPSKSSMRIPLLQKERSTVDSEIYTPPSRCSSLPLNSTQADGNLAPTPPAANGAELPSSVSSRPEWWFADHSSKDSVAPEPARVFSDATLVKPLASPLSLVTTPAEPDTDLSSPHPSSALAPTSPALFTAQGSPSPTTAQFFSEKELKEKVWYDVKSSRGTVEPVEPVEPVGSHESGSWSDGPSWVVGDDVHLGYLRITGEGLGGERVDDGGDLIEVLDRSNTPDSLDQQSLDQHPFAEDSLHTRIDPNHQEPQIQISECSFNDSSPLPPGNIPSLFQAICARALQRGYLGMDDFHAERGVVEALAEDEKWLSVDHDVAREMVNLRKENTRLKAELEAKTAKPTTSTPSKTPLKRRQKSALPPIQDVFHSSPPQAFRSTPSRTRGLNQPFGLPLSRASSSSSDASAPQAEIIQLRTELATSREQQDQLLGRAETAESSAERATESISALQSMFTRITSELEDSHRRAAMDRSEMEKVTAEYAEERRQGEAVRNQLESWGEQERGEVVRLKGEIGSLGEKVEGFFGMADLLTRCMDELVHLREAKVVLEQEITAILSIQSSSFLKKPDIPRPVKRHSWTTIINDRSASVDRAAGPPLCTAGRTM
ncbi:hypothetical protein L202_06201 [Cryptococcus amylolentus CBS 6039]|uniref:Uncharacterized protein n=1 Tax=Cryptococcus amylolentus CBS 6039 TaxID=1295533 RepID=A0A1E3HIV5_9TREE|nr:hypothetical protein L202_06201 [Cryptococcus amylolentus CBS 6039]ODN76273.1 hypothetical protein L202_06201 [Cryptococcus amylolentus CBS 6039]